MTSAQSPTMTWEQIIARHRTLIVTVVLNPPWANKNTNVDTLTPEQFVHLVGMAAARAEYSMGEDDQAGVVEAHRYLMDALTAEDPSAALAQADEHLTGIVLV